LTNNLTIPSRVLPKVGDTIVYAYDFSDSWRHEVLLEAILPVHAERTAPSHGSCPIYLQCRWQAVSSLFERMKLQVSGVPHIIAPAVGVAWVTSHVLTAHVHVVVP
jgi:hypothetical protein